MLSPFILSCFTFQAPFTHPGHSIQLQLLSYFILLFPSLDILSSYPLNVIVMVNSIYIIVTGRDTSEKPTLRCDWLLRLALKLIVAVLPILAAFGMSNLVNVLIWTGFVTVAMCITPFILQIRSIQICKEKFKRDKKNKALSPTKHRSSKLGEKFGYFKDVMFGSSYAYSTPYSFPVVSHPLTALVFTVLGLAVIIVLFLTFFIKPDKLKCGPLLWE